MTLLDKILGKSEKSIESGTCEDCKNFVNRHGDTGLCIRDPIWAGSFRTTHPQMYRDEDCIEFRRGTATLEVGVYKCETCVHFTPKLRYGGLCALATGFHNCPHSGNDLCGKYRRRE